MNSNELKFKPCPFCGGKAEVMEHIEVIGHGACIKEYYVRCIDCGANGPRESDFYKHWWQSIEDCTRKWNERMTSNENQEN